MKRLLIALVASLVLGLVGGVGPALAGDLLAPPPVADTSQTATQSNDGSNTANQSGTSEPVVISCGLNSASAMWWRMARLENIICSMTCPSVSSSSVFRGMPVARWIHTR